MPSYQSALKSTKKFGLSGTVLKLIALIAMFLDHFAEIVIHNGKLYGFSEEYYEMAVATAEGQWWLRLYGIFKLCGRISFPIFAFLLVEGFIHTSDFWKYFRRVFIMALIAEVPFDLALFNETLHWDLQNVGFTLALGLLTMYFMKRSRKHTELKWLCAAAGCAAAEFLHLDYGALGLAMIVVLYNFRKEKALRMISGAVLAAAGTIESFGIGALAYIPILLYREERGHVPMKWFFYIFYPLHIAVLYVMIYVGAMIT